MGTQLYDHNKNMIYPNSVATSVYMENVNFNKQTVENCIIELYGKYDEISGLQQQKDNIIIEVAYCRLKSKNESDAIDSTSWDKNYILPNSDNPYTWKRTTFKTSAADTNPKIIYEIVAADVVERTQTIYLAPSSNTKIEIVYPTIGVDEQGKDILNENLIQKDDWIPSTPTGETWKLELMELSAVTPEIYSATRVKKDGKWGLYSTPVRIAKWTFDSIIKLKYKTTGLNETPEFDATDKTLDSWDDFINISDDFVGKVWMVSATFVNGAAVKNTDGDFWSGPNLISIIK